MKATCLAGIIIWVLFGGPGSIEGNFDGGLKPAYFSSPPVAVIELFTSQGCSSCPAADRLLNEVIESSKHAGNVIGLSYHVSYWNYLGWKDPYSKEEYTERQKRYASALRLTSIYTPQMVVNGSTEFVGSDAGKLKKAIADAAGQPATMSITAKATVDGNLIHIQFTTEGSLKDQVLNVALVEKLVQNNVPRGENKGLVLKHQNVVAFLITQDCQKSGQTTLTIPSELKGSEGLSVVLYSQNSETLRITGAAAIGLGQ